MSSTNFTAARPAPRSGYLTVELVVAATLVVVFTTLVTQLLIQVQQHQRRASRVAAATTLVENAMQSVIQMPYAQLNETAIRTEIEREPITSKQTWDVAVFTSPDGQELPSTRVMLRLNIGQEPQQFVQLTVWRHPVPEIDEP